MWIFEILCFEWRVFGRFYNVTAAVCIFNSIALLSDFVYCYRYHSSWTLFLTCCDTHTSTFALTDKRKEHYSSNHYTNINFIACAMCEIRKKRQRRRRRHECTMLSEMKTCAECDNDNLGIVGYMTHGKCRKICVANANDGKKLTKKKKKCRLHIHLHSVYHSRVVPLCLNLIEHIHRKQHFFSLWEKRQ